jgi:hypothetical protein
VQTFDPVRSDTGWYLSAVKAIETAKHHFSGAKRPYNVAVLPADAGQFYVYLVPAQTDADSYPLGGDARFLISSNGDSIVETRQLHKSIIEFSTKESEEKKIEAGFHTAVLDDVPEDTDVFHVLARRPHVKEWVVAPTYVYVIDPDGEIRYVAPTRVFLKAQSKWQSHHIFSTNHRISSMLTAIAGPYSSSTPEGRQANLDRLHRAAAEVFRLGHIPVIGVDAALPVVEMLDGEDRYEAIMKISMAVVERCDALLIIAESPGANRERDLIAALGRPVYRSVEEIPPVR